MSIPLKHHVFLNGVMDYVAENPEVAPYVTEFVAHGIEASRNQLLEQCRDIESALSQSLYRRFYKSKVKRLTKEDIFIIEKISKWREKNKNFIKWDWLFESLENKEVSK